MSEEFIINPPEQTPNEDDQPKKRIIRRRLRPKKTPPPFFHSKAKEKKEINEVLSNLYRTDDSEDTNVQKITMEKSSAFSKLTFFLGFGVFLATVIWAGFFFAPGKNKDDSQVALTLNGPTELSFGATTTYVIAYANNSSVELKNAVINTYFPEGFVFIESSIKPGNAGHNEWNLGKLSAYQKGTISVTGINYGSIGEQKSWRVFLNYRPVNFNSELQKAATLTTAISSAPAKLTISGPDEVSVGNEVTYTFNLQKSAGINGRVLVAPQLPSNFTISSSTPTLDKNKQWQVATSSPSSPTFSITGSFGNGDSSPIKGAVLVPGAGGQNYQVAIAQLTSALVKNDVSINLAINGTTNDFESRPGDTLNMTIRVKNQSTKEISGAVLKLSLTGPYDNKQNLLNWAGFVDKNENNIVGDQIDPETRRGTVTWTSAEIPALAKLKPNSEVSFDVQLPIKDSKSFDLANIKNPLITASAEIKFKDAAKTTQSVATRLITITLNTDLTFSSDDDVANQGQVGEKHTISWVLNNAFHPLKNVVITATTYGDVTFSPVSKSAGELSYADNKITWNIDELPIEMDVANSSFSITLNKRNPTQSLLLSKAHLTAIDAITGKTIVLAAEEISLTR